MQNLEALKIQLPKAPIAQIADIIRKDWTKISPYAAPYLRAMFHLSSDTDNYYADDAQSICLYFLSNAQGWRGEVAKAVKAELKRRFA